MLEVVRICLLPWCYHQHKSVFQKAARRIVSLDSADLSGCTGSRSAMCEWPSAGLPVWEYWLPQVKSLESHSRAIIAFVFKQKRKAGQPAVRQPPGYTSQSPAGSKCIVGYPSKVV